MIDFTGVPDRVLNRLLNSVGKDITGILDTTREMVEGVVRDGIADGIGAAELGDRIELAAAFDEYRAEMIARTETATLLNRAATASYREFGVTHVTVIDGDDDEECAAANGQTWTLEEAEANPISHPNCVRDFSPIVGEVPAQAESDPFDATERQYEFGARSNEQGAIIDLETGRIVEVGDGRRGSVVFDITRGGPNLGVTHSHPGSPSSFSVDDVRFAINGNFGQMRAVDEQYVYQISRPDGGWPKWEKVRELYGETRQELYVDPLQEAIEAGDTERFNDIERDQLGTIHDIWQALADRYGFPYERSAR